MLNCKSPLLLGEMGGKGGGAFYVGQIFEQVEARKPLSPPAPTLHHRPPLPPSLLAPWGNAPRLPPSHPRRALHWDGAVPLSLRSPLLAPNIGGLIRGASWLGSLGRRIWAAHWSMALCIPDLPMIKWKWPGSARRAKEPEAKEGYSSLWHPKRQLVFANFVSKSRKGLIWR